MLTQVTKAALSLSKGINDKRKARGLQRRPVRAAVIGFPNVGKSALINRLVSRRVCDSAPKPGVTRALKWLRVGGDLDLLDAPGMRHEAVSIQFHATCDSEHNVVSNTCVLVAYSLTAAASQLMKLLITFHRQGRADVHMFKGICLSMLCICCAYGLSLIVAALKKSYLVLQKGLLLHGASAARRPRIELHAVIMVTVLCRCFANVI